MIGAFSPCQFRRVTYYGDIHSVDVNKGDPFKIRMKEVEDGAFSI
jgi:hypothetical protein